MWFVAFGISSGTFSCNHNKLNPSKFACFRSNDYFACWTRPNGPLTNVKVVVMLMDDWILSDH